MDKTEAIDEKRSVAEQIKQDAKREADEKKAETVKEEAKADAKKADGKAQPKKEAAAKEEKDEKKEKKVVLERRANISLVKVYAKSRSHRARIAISLIRQYAAKHFKAEEGKVHIAEAVNDAILSRGARNPPKLLRTAIKKFEDGTVSVALAPATK